MELMAPQQSLHGMMKEQILTDLKDLVSTLWSPNFKQEKVKQLWREKQIKFQEEVKELSSKDLAWIEREYIPWHKDKVLPRLDNDVRERYKDSPLN